MGNNSKERWHQRKSCVYCWRRYVVCVLRCRPTQITTNVNLEFSLVNEEYFTVRDWMTPKSPSNSCDQYNHWTYFAIPKTTETISCYQFSTSTVFCSLRRIARGQLIELRSTNAHCHRGDSSGFSTDSVSTRQKKLSSIVRRHSIE